MEKIFDYVNKYGNYDFDEKALGELDMLIFSHLSYLDLSNFKDGLIYDIGSSLKNYDANNLGDSVKTAYKLLSLIYDKKRYKNITMFNYKYILTDDVQVGILSLRLLNNDIINTQNYVRPRIGETTNEANSSPKREAPVFRSSRIRSEVL